MVLIMYKYHLEDVEWREFVLGEIFTIKKVYGKMIDKYDIGQLPYISTSASENGLIGFVETDEIRSISCGNAISIDPIGGKCFYHKYNFVGRGYSGASINLLYNEMINEINSKFIMTCIEQTSKTKSSYGNLFNSNRLLKGKIKLPISKNEEINWYFMEEYIKERENKKRQELKDYYKNRLLELVISPEVLTDVDWGEFFLGDIFSINTKPSKGLNHLSKDDKKGIPYVGATNRNNGVLDFVEKDSKLQYDGNCIAFIRNGEGSMGYSIYKRESFIATQDISVGYNENLNEYSAKFITTVADRVRGKYTFGYKRNQARLKKEILTLPVDKEGNPNWTYMENFIKNIEQKQIKNVLKYLDEYIYIYIYIMYNHFDKVEWKEFFLDEICNINSGVRLTKANMNEGKMPFIGATDSNNGITNFVSNTNRSLDKNVLGVNYNGSVVENFYHSYPCVFSDDVKRISFKDEQGQNKYCYMFLKQMILQQKEKYRYAYKFNGDRMARQKVMMPVDELGDIDFKFMNRYIASKEMKKLVAILKDI